MFKRFVLIVFCFVVFFLIKPGSIKAVCDWDTDPLTGLNTWWRCVDEPATCNNLPPGATCGAGVGCNPNGSGCYDCQTSGNCGGGNSGGGVSCGAGSVYDPCASGGDCPRANQTKTVCDSVCHQENNSCQTCTDAGVWADCTGGWSANTCQGGWVSDCINPHYDCQWYCMGFNWDTLNCDGGYQESCGTYCDGYTYNWSDCASGSSSQCQGWGSPYMHQNCNDPCAGTGTHDVCVDSNCRQVTSYDCLPGTSSTCQQGCTPVPCNSVAPSVPGLTSPASGAEISGTETSLAGATASWGTACSGQNYQFNIYVDQCDSLVTPSTLWKTVAASGNNFNSVFTGVGGKGYCWTASATNGVTTSAKASAQRFIFSDQPWWQVSGGSVMTFGGVTSLVGKDQKFIADAPGVVISGTGNVFLNGQDASTNKWVVTDGLLSQKVSYRYDYDYVSGRIISTIKPAVGPNSAGSVDTLKVGTPDNGVYYVLVTGNLDITSNLDFGTSKVVVLVTGDANIRGKINFTKNQGLFALYAKGNINIDSSVGAPGAGIDPTGLPAHLEGLYLAQGSINTGVAASQLRLEGAFIGIGGVNLQRNLNSAWPSEYFVFRPDILMNLPKQLLRQNHIWQELAP